MDKRLLVVTHIDFWQPCSGHRSRLATLVRFLQKTYSLTVVYAGVLENSDRQEISIGFPDLTIHSLANGQALTFGQYTESFREFIQGKTFDIVLVEYIEMAFILPFLEGDPVTFLDTHDIVHERIRSFEESNVTYTGIMLSREEECNIFNCFDYLIAIQSEDQQKLIDVVGEDRVILAPHASSVSPVQNVRKTVKQIGFIASAYEPNIDGVNWFLNEVWKSFPYADSTNFAVYGNICNALDRNRNLPPNVYLHGVVNDLNEVYNQCDIMINPVKCGAGLKIKNVEAIATGVPLITTSHSAKGLPPSNSTYYLSTDDPGQFCQMLVNLCDDFNLRRDLSKNALAVAEKYFNSDECFFPLAKAMTLARSNHS